jgi:hypothetical protein
MPPLPAISPLIHAAFASHYLPYFAAIIFRFHFITEFFAAILLSRRQLPIISLFTPLFSFHTPRLAPLPCHFHFIISPIHFSSPLSHCRFRWHAATAAIGFFFSCF